TARAVEAASQTLLAGGNRERETPTTVDEQVATGPDGAPSNMFQATEGRWGSREVEITDVKLLDVSGQASFVFHSGDPLALRLRGGTYEPVDDFVFGIGLFNAEGVCCYGTNTYLEEMTPELLSGEA